MLMGSKPGRMQMLTKSRKRGKENQCLQGTPLQLCNWGGYLQVLESACPFAQALVMILGSLDCCAPSGRPDGVIPGGSS